jgi:hypothetical protein
MSINKLSIITCPKCGHQKTEKMTEDTCQFFTSAKNVKRFCVRRKVTVVSIVPMGR